MDKTSCHEPLWTKARMAWANGSVWEDAISWIVSFQRSSVEPLTKPANATESSRFAGLLPAFRAVKACLGSL